MFQNYLFQKVLLYVTANSLYKHTKLKVLRAVFYTCVGDLHLQLSEILWENPTGGWKRSKP